MLVCVHDMGGTARCLLIDLRADFEGRSELKVNKTEEKSCHLEKMQDSGDCQVMKSDDV